MMAGKRNGWRMIRMGNGWMWVVTAGEDTRLRKMPERDRGVCSFKKRVLSFVFRVPVLRTIRGRR